MRRDGWLELTLPFDCGPLSSLMRPCWVIRSVCSSFRLAARLHVAAVAALRSSESAGSGCQRVGGHERIGAQLTPLGRGGRLQSLGVGRRVQGLRLRVARLACAIEDAGGGDQNEYLSLLSPCELEVG